MPNSSSAALENSKPETAKSPKQKRERGAATKRFQKKRELILDAATDVLNRQGLKGMTFLEVAQTVNLTTTSITYYFRFKENLAAAVFEHTLQRLEAIVDEAAQESDPRARIAAFLRLHFDHHARVLQGGERPMAILSEMRTLDEHARSALLGHYQEIFRRTRALFGGWPGAQAKAMLTARTHVLMETMFWLRAWIHQYSVDDFDRVRERLFSLFENGLAVPGAVWRPAELETSLEEEDTDPSYEKFLDVATLLINLEGYRGASVDRIVAELGLTKGSFYHRLDTKDALVNECFRRSYRRTMHICRLAEAERKDKWHQLSSSVAALLDIQFGEKRPLLRTSALQALPGDMRQDVIAGSNRIALHYAGILSDGACEGSIQFVDPIIASQVIVSTINVASEMRSWAAKMPKSDAAYYYASTLAHGLFTSPPPAGPAPNTL